MKNTSKLIIIIIIYMIFSFNNLIKYSNDFNKQFMLYVFGIIMMVIVSKIDLKNIYRYIIPIYVFLNIMLLYLLIFGNSYNGSRAWIDLKFITIQPSEFMKIVLIILLSLIAVRGRNVIKLCFIYTLIPSILTFLEPDTGNVIFYILIFLSIVFFYLKSFKVFIRVVAIISSFIVIFVIVYIFNSDIFINIFGSSIYYRMDRIIELFTSSYQLDMALINMGNGYIFGIDNIYGIPEATTDFAFSLLVSLNGFIGGMIYIVVNIIFFNILLNFSYKNIIMEYITNTFILMWFFQTSIHILMNVGLFPITGITLPFISLGGSSLISYFIMLGIISNSYMDSMVDNKDMD